MLWLLVQLPYPVIRFLGSKLGSASRYFLKRRESIARKNLELCFPHYNAQQRETLIAENFKSIGMALLETGMAWFWSDKRMARWTEVAGTGMEPVHTLQANQTGVLLIGVHFLTLEIGARMFGMQAPGIG
ncbi:lipid A biosynthesis lauroyl acyltransferase, partial [Escherichia coli]|nr:lipid A biosynthesis lauroyl acyltransferase [Escherichia coli]